MNREEATEATEKGWLVKLNRPGRLNEPYVGMLKRKLDDVIFWFEGRSGSESIRVKVKSEEVSLAGKENQ